ncbi:HTH domain-containing protein [uncultured Megamonas sp.]|uniref:HTH domain-containing protein n=1 Tax=uncultured Megamonas sp. TaxID=286140 RepID=UPI00259B0C40|nr:HTH domain-containing protein [uncultured Megamonas sp.]
MAAKVFTEEQRKILSKNPNVESVEKTRIIYTEAFKSYYVKNYLAGKKPTEIFIEAGFDPSILGNKRIERASARWRKLYADGQLIINNKENMTEKVKEEKIMNSEPTKKRRGRPRKNPVVETVVETKKEENTVDMPKKKRGRPRKNPEVISQVEPTENKAKTVKKRVNKIAAMAKNIKLAEPVVKKEVKEEAPQKKRRGRPPKNAQKAVETKVETKVEKVETQVKANERVAKKRRGRPRKVVQNVDETPVQKKENIEVKPVVKAKEESISKVEKVEKVETVTEENPVAALVKAINRLTREVNSLKRLVAGKKRINY